jgi:hypothetical protein
LGNLWAIFGQSLGNRRVLVVRSLYPRFKDFFPYTFLVVPCHAGKNPLEISKTARADYAKQSPHDDDISQPPQKGPCLFLSGQHRPLFLAPDP